MGLVQDLIATFKARDHFGRGILSATLSPDQIFLTTVSRLLFTITSKTSANRSLLSAKLAASSPSKASRSGSLPPNRHSSSSTSPNTSFNTSFNSSSSTANLTRSELYARDLYNRMSYVLVSTEDFHCGPSKISTIDPYLHEKLPFNIIKDTLYFQAEPQYDPHGRFWKFRVEDAPVRVLNKLLDLGYKVLTGTSVSGPYDHKQPGHAWTLFREPGVKFSLLNSH